jgi:autotransporter-associated beta strand protein
LGTNAGVGAETGSQLNLTAPISGNSLDINSGPLGGVVQLSGAGSNTFTGNTHIWAGTVDAAKSGGAKAISGSVVSVDGDLELGGDGELAGGVLSVDGVVRLNGHEQSGITSLLVSGNGSVVTDGSGRLALAGDVEHDWHTVGVSGDTATIGTSPANGGTLDLGGATRTFTVGDNPVGANHMDIAAGITNGGLTKAGTGTLVLSGTNSYTGPTTVTSGTLEVDGDTAMSDVTAQSGTTVAGNGTVHNLSLSGATLSPGSSLYATGTVTADNVSLDASSAFNVNLSGVAAGSQYDRLVAGGPVNLGGARLNLTAYRFNPPPDTSYTIVRNTGGSPIVGTFAGLPEGAHFRLNTWFGWRPFRITYLGGTGHDVVLTALAPDFSGDGRGDLAAVNTTSAWTMTSNGTGFAGPSAWSHAPFSGSRATLAADMDGDGRTDLVAVNDGSVLVQLSTGNRFASATTWSTVPFYGSRATLVADVNGDGRADLIAVNSDSVWVMLSTGFSGFTAPQLWSTGAFYGNRATMAADVNGDGRADLVAVNSESTWVEVTGGGRFSAPHLWSSSPFYGGITTLTGDVNGDGKADLIAVNSGSVYVMPSQGTGFSAPQLWSSKPFYGTVATLAGDFNGDGKTDLIAVNASSTYVVTSQGTRLAAPSRWSSTPFSGNVAVLSGD